ncbi:MAG: choice-of-anchor P family protein [Actinomycetota bacterium]
MAAAATLTTALMVGLPAADAGGRKTTTSPVAAESFSGRAYVADAHLSVLGKGIDVGPISDTGPLPAGGGLLEASLLTVDAPPLLEAEVASAATAGAGDQSNSHASVAEVTLTLPTSPSIVVEAAVLRSQAQAKCTADGPTTSGRSQIAALKVNGKGIAVSTGPNEEIDVLGLATITINEQTSTGPGDITVNALHVRLLQYSALGGLASGDVVISSSHADVTCPDGGEPPPPPQCQVKDFVTGGGFIIVDGSRVTFGLVGGEKPNGLRGHVNVVDHGTGGHLSSGNLTFYEVTGPTSRRLTFDSGGIVVEVTDNGEPGRDDTFKVTAGGYTRSGTLDGGNIQLHKPGGCQTTTKTKGRR